MSNLISREAAIDKIRYGIDDRAYFGDVTIDREVVNFLKSLPDAVFPESEIFKNGYHYEYAIFDSDGAFRIDTDTLAKALKWREDLSERCPDQIFKIRRRLISGWEEIEE